MKKEEILALFKSFEDAVCMIDETECWSARDLQKLFGYSLWQNFTNVIAKAKEACTNVGQDVLDHFIDVNKKVELGSGAFREIDDMKKHIGKRKFFQGRFESFYQMGRQLADEPDGVADEDFLCFIDAESACGCVQRVEQTIIGGDV